MTLHYAVAGVAFAGDMFVVWLFAVVSTVYSKAGVLKSPPETMYRPPNAMVLANVAIAVIVVLIDFIVYPRYCLMVLKKFVRIAFT